MKNKTEIKMSDWNIISVTPLPTPGELKEEFPLDPKIFKSVVVPSRKIIEDILTGEDPRMLAIVGPCSIHNTAEALEYARNLAEFQKKVSDKMFIVMRACMDKPRTGLGWSGFFQDPDLNQSMNIDSGWRRGRELLVKIVSMGLPVAMELLDADACQNIDECLSYWWVGARTVEAQRLRQISSGISTSVGFKNSADGNIDSAIQAIVTAGHVAVFTASNGKGLRCAYRSAGNKQGNLILRGSRTGANYCKESVEKAVQVLAQNGLSTRILIDVSHGNSGKDHKKQSAVIENIAKRRAAGEDHIAGFLYESYLDAGNQLLPKDLSDLKPRVSITDACDDWETTQKVLLKAHKILSKK